MLTLSHMAAWFRPADPSAGSASDERTPATDAATRAAETPPPPPSRAWLLRLHSPQTWRLASGLVLFAFVLTHYLNHALGLVSLDAMEDAQAARFAVWRSWPGTILLYGAFATHIGFALAKLVTRRTWRMPPW